VSREAATTFGAPEMIILGPLSKDILVIDSERVHVLW